MVTRKQALAALGTVYLWYLSAQPRWPGEEQEAPDAVTTLTVESADAILSGEFERGSTNETEYVYTPEILANSYGGVPDTGRAIWTFSVPAADEWTVTGNGRGVSNGNTFWARVDGGEWQEWEFSLAGFTDVPLGTFSLSEGTHTVELAKRESGCRMSSVTLSRPEPPAPEPTTGEGELMTFTEWINSVISQTIGGSTEPDETDSGGDSGNSDSGYVIPADATNVTRDYDVVADGSTNDAPAIQQAIDEASDGDTLYFPSGTYLLRSPDLSRGGAFPLEVDGDRHANNLTLVGDGQNTVLKLAGGHSDNHFGIKVSIRSGLNLSIRDLVYDGSKTEQLVNDGGIGILITNSNGVSAPRSILLKHVWIRNAEQNALGCLEGGVTVEDCSLTDSGTDHGIDARDREFHPDGIVIRRCYLARNNIYGVDVNSGKVLVEDCVMDSNGWGCKTTTNTEVATFRRCRLINNQNHGYQKTPIQGGARADVTFDDVVAEGNGWAGFRFGFTTDYTVTRIVAKGNNTSSRSPGNIYITNDANLSADEIRACEAADGKGMLFGGASDSDISRFIHSGNPGGAYGNASGFTGTRSIGETVSSSCGDIPGVPRVGDVGAWNKAV